MTPTKDELLKMAQAAGLEEEFLVDPLSEQRFRVFSQIAAQALAAPVQEPVACECNQGQVCHVCDPITPSAAQRQWVGLTDEEIEQGCKESWVTEQAFQSAVWWAEAKLKEKNNG